MSELFESILHTNGHNTDDIYSEPDNFWAPVPAIEQMFEWALREAHLREMAETNPDHTAKNIKSKYEYYKHESTTDKDLAQKILNAYTNTSEGSTVEYRPFLSNKRPVETEEDVIIFIDEVIARLQKMINATMRFYAEFKNGFIIWWKNLMGIQ